MRLLKSILHFHLRKSVNKRNTLVFVFIFVILQVFLQVGKANHSDIIESNETFQRQERQKASRYLHYRQYDTFGIWLKFVPHANRILFCDSIYDNLFCNANSTYVFNIYTPIKSRSVFANRSRFLTFSAMFLLLGVLGCLFYGMDTTVRKDYLKFLSDLTGRKKAFLFTVTARLIILFMATLFLYAISVLTLLVFDGINLFSTSFPLLLVIILSFLFFFSIGCIIGLKETQFTRTLILGGVYILSVILLPWAMGLYSELSAKNLPSLIEFDSRNFDVLMKEEEYLVKKHGLPKSNETPSEEALKDYKKAMRKVNKLFRVNEDKLKGQSIGKIKAQQTISSLFPTLFYFSVCESNSSTGVNSYMDFHSYCQEKKEGFADLIKENSFPEKDKPLPKKVENFIKGDEDLFFSKPKLPHSFLLGVICTLVYSIVMLLITYRFLMKNLINVKPKKTYAIEREEYNPVFSLCENKGIKKDIVNFYRGKERTVILEKINTREFNSNGIKPQDLFIHVCQFNGVDEKKARENLALLGIRDLARFACDDTIIMKIYAAVRTAVDFDVIVIDDFVNKESREFENGVFRLLTALEKTGKKIVYLSLHMKQDSIRFFEENVKINEFKNFPFNFEGTSVR